MSMIEIKKVQDALNKCFKHTMVWKGVIQIFPNATYHIKGKDILELFKELEIENIYDDLKNIPTIEDKK